MTLGVPYAATTRTDRTARVSNPLEATRASAQEPLQ